MSERIALITGGNKGLGYETARQLKQRGVAVTIGARDPDRGRAAADALAIDWLPLDVTDDRSVATAVTDITTRHGRLDILVNNAGSAGPRLAVEEITTMAAETVFALNLFGPVRVIHAFLPLLKASPAPVIVNVTTGLGSFGTMLDESCIEHGFFLPLYSASKAALNMLTTQYAKALPGIRINAVDPGYTATDFNGYRGTQTVIEGAEPIVELAMISADGPTGTFSGRSGPVRW